MSAPLSALESISLASPDDQPPVIDASAVVTADFKLWSTALGKNWSQGSQGAKGWMLPIILAVHSIHLSGGFDVLTYAIGRDLALTPSSSRNINARPELPTPTNL